MRQATLPRPRSAAKRLRREMNERIKIILTFPRCLRLPRFGSYRLLKRLPHASRIPLPLRVALRDGAKRASRFGSYGLLKRLPHASAATAY